MDKSRAIADRKTRLLTNQATEAIQTCCVSQIRFAARQMTRYVDLRVRRSGLTIEQFNSLTEIAAAGKDLTMTSLAKSSGRNKSTLSRNLQALEAHGLVAIRVNGADPRRRTVHLTKNGIQKLKAALPLWLAANRSLGKVIGMTSVQSISARSRSL